MGFKRPFYDEELQELPFKNPRQFDYSGKLTQFADTIPRINAPQKPQFSVEVEGGFRKYQWGEALETDALSDVTHFVDKNCETNASLSLVTSTSSEEDTGSGATADISPVSSEYFDFNFPQKTFAPVDDSYYLLLDRSPRKQVPLGPNHQANIPTWGGHRKKDKFSQNGASDNNDNDYEEIMKGTCVIPMPGADLSVNICGKVGAGRTDCSCPDKGSLRCVRQHVMEAREELRKSLGHENFVKLGFYNMGEDVAYKWSEEDEEIFREVVYSNPASSGKKFWKHLAVVFPSLSKRELVSYYFNVFTLQRRAVQNRSSVLDIDSDDDEWHGSQLAYEVQASEDDEDSGIESLADQEDLANHAGECLEEDDDDDDDDNDDDGDDSGVGDYHSDATREDCGVNLLLKGNVAKTFDKSRFNPVFEQPDKFLGVVEDFNVQDDSCMSFEYQPNMVNSHSLIDTKASLHISQLSTKGIDLQPTCNIIEEIFGQDTWDNKTKYE